MNLYFAEICHALKIAESSAVPSVELRRTSRVKGWAQNSDLVNAKAAAKFWLQIWHECDRSKSGAVNQIRIFTKRKFAKELRRHRSALKLETVSKIMDNPNLIWNLRAKPAEYNNPTSSTIGEKEWVDYFSAEFAAPDESKNQMFCEQLSPLLTKELNYFVVNSSQIPEVCKILKKKSSSGATSSIEW